MAMRIRLTLFSALFRRNAAYLTSVFIGAFAFEMYVTTDPSHRVAVCGGVIDDSDRALYRTFDTGVNKLWDAHNAGVRIH